MNWLPFMKMRLSSFLGLVLLVSSLHAQEDIIALEYFVDTDPGPGNATAVAITPGQSVNESFTVPTGALSPGYHVLGIRTLNAENRWSMYERRLFLIQDPADNLGFPRTVSNIVAAEYFIDTDPGVGNGTAIPTAGGAAITENITVPTGALSPGYHILGVRTQNAEGRWSMHERRLFLIQDPADNLSFPRAVSNITAAEYFIDTDPGPGNGTTITTAGGAAITENITVPTGALSPGYHILGVRTQNAQGRWSMHERRLFLIQDPADNLGFPRTVSNIVAAEYFIDTDPGVGNATAIPTSGGAVITENITVPTAALSTGYHILGVRTRNAQGRWSMHERRLFLIQDPQNDLNFPTVASPITELEYFIDEDPGIGNGVSVPVNTPLNLVEITDLMVSVDPDLAPGTHTFSIRAKNQNGVWGLVEVATFEFTNSQTPTLSTTADNPTNFSEIPVEIFFTQLVTGFEETDIVTLLDGQATTPSLVRSTSLVDNANGSFSVIIDAVDEGEISILIPEGAAQAQSDGTPTQASDTLQVIYDITAPAVAVDPLSSVNSSPELTGTVSDILATVEVQVDGAPYSATVNGDNTWTIPQGTVTNLAPGIYDVNVSATDLAGNVGTDSSTDELEILETAISSADSLALVALYDATGGSTNWINDTNWNVGNIQDWFGITIDAGGSEIIEINLPSNGLIGTIPAEVGQLNALQVLDLSGNSIEDIAADLSALTVASSIDLNGNRFDFGDLEPLAQLSALAPLTNQQPIDAINELAQTIPAQSDLVLTSTTNGTANTYQWSLNGVPIAGATNSDYTITTIDRNKMGDYRLLVSNGLITGLTISSNPKEILADAIISVRVLDQDTEMPIPENVNGYLFPVNQASSDTLLFSGFDKPGLLNTPSEFSFPPVVLRDFLVGTESTIPLSVNGEPNPNLIYVPTYYGNVFQSLEADTLFLNSDTTISIIMTEVPEDPQGVGIVIGTIEEDFPEEDARVDARRRAKRRKCGLRRRRTGGGRVGQEEIYDLIAYGETNDNGEFEYGFLPEGTYRFFVEYPGIPLDESAFVQFDIGETGVTDDSFVLAVFATPEGIEIELVLGITSEYFTDFSIYPNPTTDLLIIEYGEIKGSEMNMEIVSMEGKVLMSREVDKTSDKIQLDTSILEPGQYLIRFKGDENSNYLIYRLIKK